MAFLGNDNTTRGTRLNQRLLVLPDALEGAEEPATVCLVVLLRLCVTRHLRLIVLVDSLRDPLRGRNGKMNLLIRLLLILTL